ncbi:MAG: tyrosine-type recombinase/integrase [Candidatus Dormibacteraceae bacterium]
MERAELLLCYRDHLVREKGLATPTVAGYQTVARQFLTAIARHSNPDLSQLSAGLVTEFVVDAAEHRPTGTTKHLVTALRSLLRFLHLAGHAPNLAGVVPKVAGWRGGGLPRGLQPGEFARLLSSCDRETVVGRRDRAMLMLLGRLGLRVGEMIRLDLAEIDWRRGEMTVRGKARRDERMPLPLEVGEALTDYILDGRAGGPQGPVFIGWTTKDVRSALAAACRRADVAIVGAHALRHTAATEMLRAGASLLEVGQVLRHRSLSTTAIYTKVDIEPLRTMAQVWPVR